MTAASPAERLLAQLDDIQLAQIPHYVDPTEHIKDELQRLALLFEYRGAVLQKRGVLQAGDRFRGLLLREGEMDHLLARASSDGLVFDEDDPDIRKKRLLFESKTRELALREAATLWSHRRGSGGCVLPLLEIGPRFGLSPLMRQILVLALAPEVDLTFQRLFSYLLNDVTRKRPNVQLALELFGGDEGGRRDARKAFLANSPLLEFNLIELEPPGGGLESSLLLRDFKMPERMVLWLLGTGGLAPEMERYAQLVQGPRTFDGLIYAERDTFRLMALARHIEHLASTAPEPAPLIVLTGPDGIGKRSVAQRLAAHVGVPSLIVNLEATAFAPSHRDRVFRDMVREARLLNASLCLANYRDELVQGGICPSLAYLYGLLRRARHLGILTSKSLDIGLGEASAGFSTRLRLEVPETFGRLKLWQELIAKSSLPVSEGVDLRTYALKYGFTGGGILRVLDHAHQEAVMRTTEGTAAVRNEDLDVACKVQLGKGLAGVASRVRHMATLEDMVLPEDIFGTVKEIIGQARHRNVVMHDWGFDRKMTAGKGLSILFSGPPGTGKTMVAGCIANELNMDLFKVDLSQVVSKYVGETEKNLKTVFDAAQGNQFIILFDEADSLFAKRTEVKSSVDRYANLEVNYLLQKIEEYGGICVLTTNFEKGIDDAFKRRLNFRVDFPFPEKEDRLMLWRKMIPEEAPVEGVLDLEWISEKFELAGGNIKNAVLRAAFWAAERGRGIQIEDLELAAEKESREIGKLVQGVGY